MTRYLVSMIAAMLLVPLAHPAHAAITTVDGTVTSVSQPVGTFSANTIAFSITNQPPNSCQVGGYLSFAISPTSVPELEMRKNMLAILMMAKATGAEVRIGYDNAGARCDQGMLAVERVVLL